MSYWRNSDWANIEDLLGKTLNYVDVNEAKDEIRFITDTGETYLMYHEQDCCECVVIEDIIGEIEDLIGSPITMSEEVSEVGEPMDDYDESYTWTFYKLATNKGYVTIRWYGTSNGYYSESVNFVLLKEESE